MDDPPDETWAGPSRSQKKRDAHALTALGLRLTELSDGELAKLALDEELLGAVVECRRLKKNARSRQLRLIGKLLRNRELDPVTRALSDMHRVRRKDVVREQEATALRDRLVGGGDAELAELLRERPDLDRQRLRQLVRQARQVPPTPPQRRAFRELLRELRVAPEAEPEAEAEAQTDDGA